MRARQAIVVLAVVVGVGALSVEAFGKKRGCEGSARRCAGSEEVRLGFLLRQEFAELRANREFHALQVD